MIKIGTGAIFIKPDDSSPGAVRSQLGSIVHSGEEIEQWGIFEIALPGPSDGDPFRDVTCAAVFTMNHRLIEVAGFYDGNGTYRIRFMPDTIGNWIYETVANTRQLAGHRGSFTCIAPSLNSHGPVQVAHQFHFQYADGVPFFPFGTTCYSYGFLGLPYQQQTLAGLVSSGFNKVRMCLLPKLQGKREFKVAPFESGSEELPKASNGEHEFHNFRLTRFNPVYFQWVENRIRDLMALGIEAEIILFFPHDPWSLNSASTEAIHNYVRYAVRRLAAFRNVWWSMANEYDLIKTKTTSDWDTLFRIVQASDPYNHLRSIHHSKTVYDHSKPWVTHASLQEFDFSKATEYRAAWNKPIIWDEIQYEGNIAARWGNLSPEEMTRRFWLAVVAGTYATHGETYNLTDGANVWTIGGELRGTSAPRIAFLRKIVESITTVGINEFEGSYYNSAGCPNELYLYYFDFHCVGSYEFPLPQQIRFRATLIDPWNMTLMPVDGTFSGKSRLTLTGKPYMAALFQRVP